MRVTTFDLAAIGFVNDNDGTLRAPAGSTVTIVPTRCFYCVEITVPTGAVAACAIHKTALKIRERASANEVTRGAASLPNDR